MLLTAREGWDEDEIRLEPATDARTPPNQLAEARFLAMRLRELADQGVDRGSMVVLLRSFTRLDAHEDSLERAGLRPYVVGGRGYWSQQQVADVCTLLATIANPARRPGAAGSARLAGLRRRPRHALAAARRRRRRAPHLAHGRGGGRARRGRGHRRRAARADPRRRDVAAARLRRDAAGPAPPRHVAPPPRPDRRRRDRDRLRPGGADAPLRRGALRQRAQADPAGRGLRSRRGARPARPARLPRGAGRRRRRRPGGDRGRGPRRGADHDHPQRQGPRVRRRRDPPPLARPAAVHRQRRCSPSAASPSSPGSGCSCGGSAPAA